MMEPTVELTRLEVFSWWVAVALVAWLVVRFIQRLRRRSDAWEKAAWSMIENKDLWVREWSEAVGGLAIRPRDPQELLSESEARGWLVRYTGVRSDAVRVVQNGIWWTLESPEPDADQRK